MTTLPTLLSLPTYLNFTLPASCFLLPASYIPLSALRESSVRHKQRPFVSHYRQRLQHQPLIYQPTKPLNPTHSAQHSTVVTRVVKASYQGDLSSPATMRSNSISSMSSVSSRASSVDSEETMQVFVKNVAGDSKRPPRPQRNTSQADNTQPFQS